MCISCPLKKKKKKAVNLSCKEVFIVVKLEYLLMRETCVQMYFVYTMVYITEVHSFSLVFFLFFFFGGWEWGTGLYSNSNSTLLSNTPYIIPCVVLVVNIF